MESGTLKKWVDEGVQKGRVKSRQDVIDVLSFTFLARRVKSNPTYYDAGTEHVDEVLSRFADRLWPAPVESAPPQGGDPVPESTPSQS